MCGNWKLSILMKGVNIGNLNSIKYIYIYILQYSHGKNVNFQTNKQQHLRSQLNINTNKVLNTQ